jgi:acyl-CoA thioesterase
MDKLFFDLRATHNPHRWYLPVDASICVGPPGNLFMFGGVGMASAVAALERTTGRPLIWATAQYLGFARPGSVVDIDVWTPVQGKYNTQANTKGHVDDKEIISVSAALGARPSELSGQWTDKPDAPPPEDCDPSEHWRAAPDSLHSRMEVRIVKGRSGKDRIGNALGKNAGGNSLDNTLRIRRIVPTDWVLCDIRINGVHGGFGHGAMHLYAQDGELMATASQSLIVRVRDSSEDR